ncbi:sensor histidine kinase [Niabella hirudinis]|uniref:sensor histidine kinase n=1 Tax=Niabella hirudinis TaxID=1285929 RepID=UPI003EB92E31
MLERAGYNTKKSVVLIKQEPLPVFWYFNPNILLRIFTRYMKRFRLRFGIPLYWLLCLLGSGPALCRPQQKPLIITGQEVYPVADYLHWMQTAQRMPADSAFYLLQNGAGRLLAPDISINSGFSSYYYWMTFTLQNRSDSSNALFYQFNNPYIDVIDIYLKTTAGFEKLWTQGSLFPFATRSYPYHDFVFPISMEAGQSATYLIMAEKRGELFSTKPELMSARHFKKKEQNLYLVFGTIMGMMLFNILINIFLGISLKDRIHFLYALYVCVALIWFFSSMGIDYQLFFPNHPAWFQQSQGITGAVTMVLMAQLATVFLKLKQTKARAYTFLTIAKWVLILILPVKIGVYTGVPYYSVLKKIVMNIYLLAVAGIALGMIWAAILRIRQGFKPAWFFLAAMFYLAFSIAKTCYIIIGRGDVSELVSPPTNIQQGIIIETIIIFIGIIYRYNLFKNEKETLRLALAGQQLQMAQQIVSAQEEERKRLAQDLHDDVGATLSSLLLHITNPPETGSPATPAVQQHYERSTSITKKALTDLRNISHNLLPKDLTTLYLFQELKNRMDVLNSFGATRFAISTDGDDTKLNEMQTVTLYRVINELVNNIVKHAKASQANIDITIADEQITLVVEDNGIGFTTGKTAAGIGLKNISSRVAFLNGTINIDTNRQGTTIIIVIPL